MIPYTIDPYLIGIEQFYSLTASKSLLPGRIALKDEMEGRFSIMNKSGIENLGMLLKAFNSREQVQLFAKTHRIPQEYLFMVRREAGSYLARPFPLKEFPGVPFEYCKILHILGLRNTREYFEFAQGENVLYNLSQKSGVPVARLKEIFVLCNLSRIGGVGPVFSRIVYETDIRSVKEFAGIRTGSHCPRFNSVIDKRGYATARLSENDVQYCIGFAKLIVKIYG